MDVYYWVSNFLNIYMQNRQCAYSKKKKNTLEKDMALISSASSYEIYFSNSFIICATA